MKRLLDTSVIIDFLRRKDKESTVLYGLTSDDLYVSIISHTEIFSGKSVWESEQSRGDVIEVFSGLTIIPLERRISEKAGEIKVRYGTDLIDAIIGASAVESGLELVTLNRKHFEKIEGVKLLDL